LDLEGQPIESELNYTLQRTSTYEPLTPDVPLRGMYSQSDAGAVVEECTTGLTLAVEGPAMEGLAQEFAKLRKGPDRRVLLAAAGRIDVPADSRVGVLTTTS